MDFEAALTKLASWLGCGVIVRICAADAQALTAEGMTAEVARLVGVLDRAQDRAQRSGVEWRDSDKDDVFFSVGEGGDGFFLNPHTFRDCSDFGDQLWIHVDGSMLMVQPSKSS